MANQPYPNHFPASTKADVEKREVTTDDTSRPDSPSARKSTDELTATALDDGKKEDEALAGIPTVASGEVDYHSMNWWQCGMIMIAETISLGILSLPSVLANVGLIPGVILLIGLGVMSSYSGYVMYQFRQAYPQIHSMADSIEVLFSLVGMKRFGREFGAGAYIIFLVFCMASHILTWIICLQTLSSHSVCNIVWGVVGMAVFWVLDIPRTCKKMSYMSIASFASITIAVVITMVAVGVEKPAHNQYSLWPKPGLKFREAFLSIANILFAYGGHVAFFGFMAELRDPRDFPKSLALLQTCDITMYIIVAIVIYIYTGATVKSPALSSAGVLVSKIAFGIAIPTIIIAGVIFGHVASKYIFNRIFARHPHHINTRTRTATISWLSITLLLWVIAFIIALSIPFFNELLGLVSSLFASWFTFGLPGIFWLCINKGRWTKGYGKVLLTLVNGGMMVCGAAICVIGVYASGTSIRENTTAKSWSC
ncbi:amino acid transporter protein [Rutstroemia sp. NJR-2017a BVV2]|nr:amino acid transporter protein [Rutstroemia sp. NJR-2017a BVV2]